MDMITAADFERQMKALVEESAYMWHGDTKAYKGEIFHPKADELMCKTLRSLGYDAGVNIFEKMPRHYSE